MPKVSIIVPVFNVEKYLNRCINSLLNQTLRDIEVILVDDESPDNCPAICDDFAKHDSRIKVLHKKNEGLGMACNSGIEIALGDFIAFCDSDDWVDLECYETLYNTALMYDADAVYSGIKRINEKGVVSPMSQSINTMVYRDSQLLDFAFDMIATAPECKKERERQMSAKIVLYSGEIIRSRKVRFHSERDYISEDLLFNLDFIKESHSVVEIPKTFYYYFTNTTSISHTFRHDRFEKYKYLRRYLIERYDFQKRSDEFLQRVDKLFIGYVRNAMSQIVLSRIPKDKKRELLSRICNDHIWKDIARKFPINKMPIPKRMIFWLTYFRLSSLIIMIFKFNRKND